MALQTKAVLFDGKGKQLKSTQFSKAHSFHIYAKSGTKWVRLTEERLTIFSPRDPSEYKRDIIDTFILAFNEEYIPAAQAHKPTSKKLTKGQKSKIIRKKGPKLGDLVPGYPPLDPPRKVDRKERQVIRGQARLKLQEEYNITGPESQEIIEAMFKAFSQNLPLIPKLLEEFMVVYYLQNKVDKRSQVKRMLAGREVTTEIKESPFLQGQLSQIDTLLKLSLIKVEKEVISIVKEGEIIRVLQKGEKAYESNNDVKLYKRKKHVKTYRDSEVYEELTTTDHLFAKVVATYRGNMEMSVDDLQGGDWRDEVFDTVIMDILNVFQGFVDNGVFEYSKRPEYIIRIVCPLFDKDYGVQEALKTSSGDKRYGLGISLDRTFFDSLDAVKRHLQRPNTQKIKTPELDRTSLFDRVKNRLREYLKLNRLNTFAITGFTIERLIWE